MNARATIVTVTVLLLLSAFAATAQGQDVGDVADPLLAKTDEKTRAAAEDPTRYVTDQASEERLEEDAAWSVAYGCYALHVATRESGQEPPELDACRGFEEAVGIQEEDPEEATADAEELEEAVAVEAQAVAEDLEATADRILDDPTTVADESLGFLERTLAAIGRITGSALAGIGKIGEDLGAGIGSAAEAVWQSSERVLQLPADALLWTTDTTVQGSTRTVDATVGGIRLVASGIGQAAGAVSDGIDAAVGGLGAMIDDLFAADRTAAAAPDAGAAPSLRVDDETERLQGTLERVVGDATP